MSIILGIKGGKGLHNSSTAIIDTDNDDILFVGEEERFCGRKHTDFFPIDSMIYGMKKLDLNPLDVEYVSIANDDSVILNGYYETFNKLKLNEDLINKFKNECFDASYVYSKVKRRLRDLFPVSEILNINHHDTHAALAFYTSDFEEAAYFTADGMGEFETMTFGHCVNNKVVKLRAINYPNSLGFMYTHFCHILGFGGPNPEGKIMALASFGEPKFLNSFEKIYNVDKFSFGFNEEYIVVPYDGGMPKMRKDPLMELFGKVTRKRDEKLEQIHFDLAASLQKFFEKTIISLANDLYEMTKLDNIVVGGGSFLNSVVNNMIIDNTPFKNIFINPASHDGGNAIGAALYTKHNILKRTNKTNFSVYCGYEITSENSKKILDHEKIKYTIPENLSKRVAELLDEGNIIGLSTGKAEIGPRALCNRSILVEPTKHETIDYLNKHIKRREWFRPYAPVAMEEFANEYFKMDNETSGAPYMLKVYDIREDKVDKIKAISHVDKSARVQTVNKNQNENMYNILKEYNNISGIPVLLNTSFNVGGESIVNNEVDSFMCFVFSNLDYLVLDKFLISRDDNIDTINNIMDKISMKEYFENRNVRYYLNNIKFILKNNDIFSTLNFNMLDNGEIEVTEK